MKLKSTNERRIRRRFKTDNLFGPPENGAMLRKERYDSIYKQVNAMYYEKRTISSIVKEILARNDDLCEFQIIEMIQAVEARNKMRVKYNQNAGK